MIVAAADAPATLSVRARDRREVVARVGLVAKGGLYLSVGVAAVMFALGRTDSDSASQTGVIETMAGQPFGAVVVGALAVGLLLHGLWQLVATFTGDPVEGDGAKERAKFLAKAVIYLGLAGLATSKLVSGVSSGDSSGGGGSSGGTDAAASTLLSLPFGVWIAAGVGLVVAGIGVYEIVRHGRQAKFMERIGRTEDGAIRRNVRRAGRVGYSALGVVSLLAGAFFVVAAIQHDPDRSKGMSETLRTIADQPWGPPVLYGVAVGVVLYGLFTLAESRYRRAA